MLGHHVEALTTRSAVPKSLTLTLMLTLHVVVSSPTPGMSDRLCPGCDVRIVRGDPSLAACVNCKRIFHQICLSLTAPGSSSICASCSAPPSVASSPARTSTASTDAQPFATPTQPISPAIDLASHSATATAIQCSSKRRNPAPSPSTTPLSKAHRVNPAADMDGMHQGHGVSAPYNTLDADCSIRAALQEAPAYMHVFYNLLKS